MQKIKLKTGPWKLADLESVPKNGKTVFSCFHCGGGSTMGYKLAGYTVLGGVEIDPEMMEIYRANHNPKLSYLMGVQEFAKIPDKDLPPELFNLDVLDGSPPCSSFSMAGSREKAWGEKKKFREGQADQVLDDLFFDFIAIAKKLRPKVVVAENVKGLIAGNARGYVKQIFTDFKEAGYDCQLFLLNASAMGVPQARERTFFIARRRDLGLLPIKLEFNEPQIPVKKAIEDLPEDRAEIIGAGSVKNRWMKAPLGGYSKTDTGSTFGFICRTNPNQPSATVTASPRIYHWKYCRRFNAGEVIRLQSFPEDFNFVKAGDTHANYVCGMSVPPFMMQRVSAQVYEQLLANVRKVDSAPRAAVQSKATTSTKKKVRKK